MKRVRVISFGVFIVAVVVFGFGLVPGIMDQIQSRNAAQAVLENVIDQNYEKAFENIYFYDKASDLDPTIAYNDAKNKWVDRVKALKEKEIYLIGYNQLRVRLDDSYPEGSVDLVVMENGKENVKSDVRLWFGKTEKGWKLGRFDYYKDNTEEAWEIALSGNMK